jgi:2-polyprenyl-3-methyl-5-hydroxy-6-metoxy-1,4-benzoquinol methylase/glycosyltransferase involved in cell wall biosynthesis
MFIVMHCGGIPFNGDTIKTKSLGGSESAAYYVAKELAAFGHHVTMFTNSRDTGTFDKVKYEFAGELTEDTPLGDRFTFYAENTPHDLCIIQRHPRAFERKWASKQNMLWLHDLALYRNKDLMASQMWNVNHVLVVSEYHKQQVCAVYGLPENRVVVVKNGVDLSVYDNAEPIKVPSGVTNLFYSSRPERGLEELVKPGGIMDQLRGKPYFLHVCGYDNTTPQMRELYEYLWARCEALPNVHNHGALSKVELASLQNACDAWVYPTAFEEVSCITAMEAMAANCEIVASKHAAIPETCAGTNAMLIPLLNGKPNINQFVHVITELLLPAKSKVKFLEPRRAYAQNFTWASVAIRIIEAADTLFKSASYVSLAHHFIRHSDIKAFEELSPSLTGSMGLRASLLNEYDKGYKFYRDNTYAEHYAAYYEYEKNRGVNYGPEDVTRTTRFTAVAQNIAALPSGSRVLDYGCAHGHYTIALARSFPALTFFGADISQSNIDKANAWAIQEGLTNVTFHKVGGVETLDKMGPQHFDLIIAAEIIEHVGNPQEYIDRLSGHLALNGMMVITVPYGPWEAQGYREHKFWRAHLHHFERQDLLEMLGHHPEYKTVAVPSGSSQFHSALGSYVVTFRKPLAKSRAIDYARKVAQTMPDQTISCCMIVKDAQQDILRCLQSVAPHVQEFIIGVDRTTTDTTGQIIANFARANPLVAIHVELIESPTVQGFAAARNQLLPLAAGDWILWIDSDEVLINGNVLPHYLRDSMYNGFAVKQHHFSHDPVAVIKVDLPCRLFRNYKGVTFFGCVHEHPEIVMNEGLGPVSLMPQVNIVHHGYIDEGVRRKRFNRNLPLLARDRAENPTRLLGKFLWLRDLAQSCQYDMEAGTVNPAVFDARVIEGVTLWEELLEEKNLRLLIDAMPYYSQLAMITGDGVAFSFAIDASWVREADAGKQAVISGYFVNKEHALRLMNTIAADKFGNQDRRYL